jgi:CO dehydrogenase maturation factor
MKIAVCGKGGVGKSTVSAFIIQRLALNGDRVLAIDADPSPHLARLLGFPDEEMTPIADMKELLTERSGRNGPFYNLNPKIDDLPEKFIRTRGNISLLVMGAIQQGGAGCACAENTVLRNLLNMLLISRNEHIVLDMEAGVEHLGRGTIETVDNIVVIIQPYRGSVETAKKITRLAKDLRITNIVFVANNVTSPEDTEYIEDNISIKLAGSLPASNAIRHAERKGENILDSDSEFAEGIDNLIKNMGYMA